MDYVPGFFDPIPGGFGEVGECGEEFGFGGGESVGEGGEAEATEVEGASEGRFFELFEVPEEPTHCLCADAEGPHGEDWDMGHGLALREVSHQSAEGDSAVGEAGDYASIAFAGGKRRGPGFGGGSFPHFLAAGKTGGDFVETNGAAPVGEGRETAVVFEDGPGETFALFLLAPGVPSAFEVRVGGEDGASA